MRKISKNAVHLNLQRILREKGFSLYRPKNHKRPRIVCVEGNVVTPVEPEVLLPIVLEIYMKDAEKNSLEEITAKIFENEPETFRLYLEMTLDPFDGTFRNDSSTTTHFYFKNGVLAVTADDITRIEYADLPGHVWNRQIVDFDLDLQSIESVKKGKFYDFIDALGYFAIEAFAEERVCHLTALLGSLLNNYNNAGIPEDHIAKRVVFLSNSTYICAIDKNITQISLIASALAKIVPTAFFEGNDLDDPDHVARIVSDSTRLVVFADVTKCNPDHIKAILEKRSDVKILILSSVPFKDLGVNQFSIFPSQKAAAWTRLFVDLGMEMEKLEVDRFYTALVYMAQMYLARGIVESLETNCEGMISLVNEAGREFIQYIKSEIEPGVNYSYVQILEDYNYGGDTVETIDLETFKKLVRDYAKVTKISMVETQTIGDESFRYEYVKR